MRHTTQHYNATRPSRFHATATARQRIREQGRRQDWLAQRLGMSMAQFSRILSGERTISEADGRVLAALLDTEFSLLFELSPDKRCSPNGKRSDGQ